MKRWINNSNRDYYAGALMFALGIGAILEGRKYSMGTLSRMGPGYFPVSLGVILALVGAAIAITNRFAEHDTEDKVLPPEWRGWICICLSIIAFVVLGKYGGLVPATFAIVFISALGDRQNTIRQRADTCRGDRRGVPGRLLVGAADAVPAVRAGADHDQQSLHRPVVRLRRRAPAAQPDVVVLRRADRQPDRRAARHGRAVGDLDAAAADLHDARRCRRS